MVEKNKLQFAEIARRFSSKCQASIPSFYGIAWRSSSEVGPHYFGLCSKARFSFVFILQPGNSSVEEFHHGAGKFFPGAGWVSPRRREILSGRRGTISVRPGRISRRRGRISWHKMILDIICIRKKTYK